MRTLSSREERVVEGGDGEDNKEEEEVDLLILSFFRR